MNILSLFDGMSCGQIALDRLGIKVDNYFASEIDKYAIQVTQANFPNTKQIGSVVDGFSFAGKQLNFEDPRSKLFFEFVRLIEECKPKYFLLENVKMKKECQEVITKYLGVEPIEINSNLVSAQSRKRLYWTNIPDVQQPEQVDYNVNELIEGEGFPTAAKLLSNPRRVYLKKTKIFGTLTAVYYKGVDGGGRPCVSTKEGELRDDRSAHRMLTPIECERLQTVPDNYTNHVSNSQRYKMLGNGWTVDVIAHIFKNLK